jgi:hypothetical protein
MKCGIADSPRDSGRSPRPIRCERIGDDRIGDDRIGDDRIGDGSRVGGRATNPRRDARVASDTCVGILATSSPPVPPPPQIAGVAACLAAMGADPDVRLLRVKNRLDPGTARARELTDVLITCRSIDWEYRLEYQPCCCLKRAFVAGAIADLVWCKIWFGRVFGLLRDRSLMSPIPFVTLR